MPKRPNTMKTRERVNKKHKNSRKAQKATFAIDIRKLKVIQKKLN